MRSSVKWAIRLGCKDGAEFEKLLNYARADIIIREQRIKEAARKP